MSLKISVKTTPSDLTLKLEGRVIGPWAIEFDRAWQSLAGLIGTRTFCVDLCGVTYMDAHSRKTLSEIHRKTGAEFLADSPMTLYFAREAQGLEQETKTEVV